jgi:hypothetical protein
MKAKTKYEDYWDWYRRKLEEGYIDLEERAKEMDKIIKEARIQHGQYEENEFGPECP